MRGFIPGWCSEPTKENDEKYLNAVDKQYDLEQDRYSLIEKGFNLVKTEFEKAIEVITDGYSFVDKRINRIQEHGYFVNDSYYNQQIGYKKAEKAKMEAELEALQKYMKENASTLDPKSEAYQDLLKQIRDLELSIEDAATDLVVLQKTIREAAWERFDWLQGRIATIIDESNFMIEVIGEDKLYDDNGLFNSKAWATAGLYMTNYDIYAKQVGEYEKEYKRVQKELAKDPNNKEIREHLEEINSQWQEAINNVQEQKQNIKNLVEEGINEYLSKLQEAIDDYKKLLQNAKSLYEWQNTIDEKTENIARLRKQLSVYGGDDSEENRANLQRLNQQLSEAEKDLKETEWDHYIQETESFLDEMYSDMEEFLNKYLENIDLVVKDIATGVNERGKEISETVKSEAKAVGYNLSDTMNSIFATDGIVVSTINKNGDLINKISGQVTTVVSAINQLEDTIKKIMVNDETGKKVEDESPKTKDEGQDYKGTGGGTGKVDSKTGLIDIGKNAVRRMYNEKTGEHFYTTSDTEAAALVKAGWKDEGKAWDNEDAKTGVPVYRVYNPIAGDHHYTINKDEVQTLVKAGWKDEGIAFYGAKQGNKVYRVYNPNNGKHHYTLNANEVKKLVSAGWKDEGVAWIANYTSNVQELLDKVNDEIDRNGPINTGIRTSGYLIDRTTKGYATGSEHIDKDELAWTQENGGEIIYRKKDGAVLTPLNTGDKVFTNEMSQRLWELASTTPQSLINNNTVPAVSNLSTTVNQNNSINITLPNVTNYEQFKSALQKDSKFEGFIKEITFGQALGYNSLKKYSY